jgi:hypothetical protein
MALDPRGVAGPMRLGNPGAWKLPVAGSLRFWSVQSVPSATCGGAADFPFRSVTVLLNKERVDE